MSRNDSTETRQKTGQTTGQTTRQTTGQISDKEHQDRLTGIRKKQFAAATHEQQEEAQQYLNERSDELARQQKADSEQADRERWARRERREREENERKKAQSYLTKAVQKIQNLWGGDGGSKSKEILGKQRRIYKVAGSRKEHEKYKGQIIPVSDYKKLMKLKR
jgi:hypothetical protein